MDNPYVKYVGIELRETPPPPGPDDFRIELTTDKELYALKDTVFVTLKMFNTKGTKFDGEPKFLYVALMADEKSGKKVNKARKVSETQDGHYPLKLLDSYVPGKMQIFAHAEGHKFITYIHIK